MFMKKNYVSCKFDNDGLHVNPNWNEIVPAVKDTYYENTKTVDGTKTNMIVAGGLAIACGVVFVYNAIKHKQLVSKESNDINNDN